ALTQQIERMCLRPTEQCTSPPRQRERRRNAPVGLPEYTPCQRQASAPRGRIQCTARPAVPRQRTPALVLLRFLPTQLPTCGPGFRFACAAGGCVPTYIRESTR